MGGGPCVRLVLPWSGSSLAIEAAGRQNRAGGGTEREHNGPKEHKKSSVMTGWAGMHEPAKVTEDGTGGPDGGA